jgi:hypothetical protein
MLMAGVALMAFSSVAHAASSVEELILQNRLVPPTPVECRRGDGPPEACCFVQFLAAADWLGYTGEVRKMYIDHGIKVCHRELPVEQDDDAYEPIEAQRKKPEFKTPIPVTKPARSPLEKLFESHQ